MMNLKQKLRGARRSATIWLNGMLLAALPLFEVAKGSLGELQQYLPDNVYKWVGLAVVVGNIVLRFRTSTDLASK